MVCARGASPCGELTIRERGGFCFCFLTLLNINNYSDDDHRRSLTSMERNRSSNLAASLRGGAAATATASSSSAAPTGSAAANAAAASSSTTFFRSASIVINEPVGSMSMSPANRDVVLAARKGLYIVDLESPFAPPRFLAQLSTWEAADVQWSPHPARSHWVASTSHARLLIWNLDRPEGAPRGPAPLVAANAPPRASTRRRAAAAAGRDGMPAVSGTSATPPISMGSLGSSPSLHGSQPRSYPHLTNIVGPTPTPSSLSSSSPRSSAIEQVLHGHTRAITDINFSAHHPDVLASCGNDAWSWVWDLRTPQRPVQGYSAWNAGAMQIKWNRSTPHRLATAVTNKVLIWDDRKGALPLATIEAHEAQIYGLDWSRDISAEGSNRLVTCSLDGAVKFWDLAAPASQSAIASRSLITEPEQTIETDTPIWRARHLPFGRGVMTLPQRGDTTLSMWARDDADNGPVERFVGHKDIVKEYLFRTRGGQEESRDERRFQLVTWSKDQTLRLWPVSEEAMRKVGHDPDRPIRVLQTRKGAKDVSYRDPPVRGGGGGDTPAHADAAAANSSSLLPAGTPRSPSSPETLATTATNTHVSHRSSRRSSMMPAADATASLISGPRGFGAPRFSAGGGGGGGPHAAGATATSPASPASSRAGPANHLLSASLQNRLNSLSVSAGTTGDDVGGGVGAAGESPTRLLSRSVPHQHRGRHRPSTFVRDVQG